MFNKGIKRLRRDLDDLDQQINCTGYMLGTGAVRHSLRQQIDDQKSTVKSLSYEVDRLKAILAEVVDYVYKDGK